MAVENREYRITNAEYGSAKEIRTGQVKESSLMGKKRKAVPPLLLSAVVCDRVIFDRISGAPSLINIIELINAPKYPARHSGLVFFCELTNGYGKTKTKIRLVDVQQDDRAILEREGTVEFKDVRQIVRLAVDLHGIIFPHPGEYRFQLFAEGELLGERRIVCRKIKRPSKGDQEA
jgi:hypothetical protein